jgi:hypothetical protein
MAGSRRSISLPLDWRSLFLIFGGQQQRGHRAIRLGDDPEKFRIGDLIAAHQGKSILETQFVVGLAFLAEISPISTQVTEREVESRSVDLLQKRAR